MKNILLLVAVAFFMCNCYCQPSEDVTIFVAPKDSFILDSAVQAANEWNACNKSHVTVTNQWVKGAITLGVTKDPIISSEGVNANGITYWVNENPSYISVHRMPGYLMRVIIAHEIGHVLTGREHFGTGLMTGGATFPKINTVTQLECDRIPDE